MKVSFVDFKEQNLKIKDQIDLGFKKVIEKGNFILGEEEKVFEDEFAQYCGAKYAIGVNSGTDALYLALAALGIGEGDEVILPSYTFIATALCISYAGAKPVFVDIEENTYNLDPKKLKKAITKRTKAVIVVHLYGQPAEMDEINKIAKENDLFVVEDAAQSHGAVYKGKRVGSLGDVSCFSFYPTKGLGAFGDGGMIVTSNEKTFEKAKMLRDYGRVGRYEHKIKGYNSRLDTLQAVVLSAKLKYLDEWNEMRNDNAQYYGELLKNVKGVIVPKILDNRTHVFQTYAIRVKNRDNICEAMQKNSIGVLIHYPIPIHLQEAYKELKYKKGDLPLSERIADEILSLPMYPHMNKDQIGYVCSTLKDLL